ncbi:uncharacterized protein LOC116427678 isoform X2 [Nomia melanderi]|uniref:uncharacterized protein LOC116427678 isoform X2 n=1 Tax=Nomia melanderi TaxID=2448451 RepID=UPI003FCCD3DB
MQWRRQRRVTHVIGSSNHVLLLARYQDAPPDEEDEKEGLRNGYVVKGRENDPSAHTFKRNGQGTGYKPREGSNGGSSSGYNGGGTRPHRDDSAGSSSQPKMVFNEDEYTRVTTPRQDILFKKSYLLQKKPWAENASTSATPSTTESQSASHSTADGSETTEDQQLLDCGTSENPVVVGSNAQVGYGTFYDHATGYYYEYPVMLFGPTMVPTPMGPDVTAAVACGPVPLRPIEWINPAFVPKLSGQPYCMNYQCTQSLNPAIRGSLPNHDSKGAVIEEEEGALVPLENTNGTCNESGTGSVSCSGSVTGEGEEQPAEVVGIPSKDQIDVDYQFEEQVEEQCLMNGMNDLAYMKPMLMQQPVHMSHVLPAVPQPYMYPGHYMFGPPLVNVNGVTIQCGPMIRTTDVAVMSAGCGRRKKKKKRNNQTLVTGNTKDEEEGENSSECDTDLASSRLSWTGCPTSTTTTTSARTLKPDCKEFQSRLIGDPDISFSADTPISEEDSVTNQLGTLSSNTIDKNNEPCNGVADDSKNSEDELVGESSNEIVRLPSKIQSDPLEVADENSETNRLTNHLTGKEDTQSANDSATEVVSSLSNNINDSPSDLSNANDSYERSREEVNGVMEEISLVNGKLDSDSNNEDTTVAVTSKTSSLHNDERTRSRSGTPKTVSTEKPEKEENHESLTNAKSSLPKRKYSTKGTKFVREPTPGPDLDSTVELDLEKVNDATQSLNNVSPSNFIKEDSIFERDKTDDNEVSSNCMSESVCNHLSNEDPIEASNDDSGFESQTKHSEYPITEAVTQWLRKANSPEMFITSSISDNETENEDEVEEPPKNLEGNPIPALSVNSGVDNLGLSRTASCSEFARINNVKGLEQPDIMNSGSRKKKDNKKRSGERRRVRHAEGKLDEVISSSDSCGQQDDSVNKKKNSAKDVGDVCEFTEVDSVADMRVASNSRMDSKRVNARRTKRQGVGRSNEDLVNNNEKIKRVEDENNKNENGIVEDTVNVKTFEKGEIVVSEDGKLLTTSVYETLWNNNASIDVKAVKSETTKETVRNREKRSSSVEEENASGILSLDSIEELDVLECWEAETIEPVITPKKVLQCRGVSCEGEAGEEDNIDLKQVNMDYVQKYYRLARESATSIEEDLNSKINIDSVPNRSEESEAEVIKEKGNDTSNIPIDEAFEVYESCYTGKAPFLTIDSKVFKSRTLYGQEGEGPIPCRAVCCNIQ